MPFFYRNLDERTRRLMQEELDRDLAAGRLYLSDNLNPQGKEAYPNLLRSAAISGSDATLAAEIRGRLNTHQKPRALKGGGFSSPPVMRVDAHEVLAEGEFTRLYMKAICLRAIEDRIADVVIYRAKQVESPRAESEARIGMAVSAQKLLEDLRAHPGLNTALGIPPGPNSGLCVHLP